MPGLFYLRQQVHQHVRLQDVYGEAAARGKHECFHVPFPGLHWSFLCCILVIFAAETIKSAHRNLQRLILCHNICFKPNPFFTKQQRAEIQNSHTNQSFCVCVCAGFLWSGEVIYNAAKCWHVIRRITRFLSHLDMFILRVCATVEPETRRNVSL